MSETKTAPKDRWFITSFVALCLAVAMVALTIDRWQREEALIAAIKSRDTPAVSRLLSQGANANAKHGEASLTEMVLRSLNVGDRSSSSGKTPLCVALCPDFNSPDAQAYPIPEHLSLIKALLDAGAVINMSDDNGITPLMHAVEDGQPNVVRLLLRRGADPNLTREPHGGALVDSIWVANNAAITNMLLDAGANIDQRTLGKKETALMVAARLDKPSFVKLLVDRGANLDVVNADGDTALKVAQRARASASIIVLLSRGNHSSGTSDGRIGRAPVH